MLPLARVIAGNGVVAVKVDNAAVVRLVRRGTPQALSHYEGLSKPLKLRAGLLHDLELAGVIRVEHVPTDRNVADIGTKALGRLIFERVRDMLGVCGSEKSQPHQERGHAAVKQFEFEKNEALQQEVQVLQREVDAYKQQLDAIRRMAERC